MSQKNNNNNNPKNIYNNKNNINDDFNINSNNSNILNNKSDNNPYFNNGMRYMRYLLLALGIYLSFRFLLPLILPLVLAVFLVIPTATVIRRISKRFHVGKGLLTGGLLILIVFVLLMFVAMVIFWVLGNLSAVLKNSSEIGTQFCTFLCDGCGMLESKLGMNPGSISKMVTGESGAILERIKAVLLSTAMSGSVKSVKGIVNLVITFLITALAAVLLAKDYEEIMELVERWKDFPRVRQLIQKVGRMLLVYMKAQGIIYLVIAGICTSGYYIMGLSHPIQTGLITAFMDILPFIGTGIIIVPLAIWQILNKEYWKVLICIILYLLTVFARQLLEPRLIGKKTGIFPVFVLISIFAGMKLYGIGGVILGPLSFLLYIEITKMFFAGENHIDKAE